MAKSAEEPANAALEPVVTTLSLLSVRGTAHRSLATEKSDMYFHVNHEHFKLDVRVKVSRFGSLRSLHHLELGNDSGMTQLFASVNY